MLFAELIEVLDPEAHGAALNMAIDEALLRTASKPLLRVYRWVRPAISFGYFEKFADVERGHLAGEMVRRWTGGGVVFHGDDLTYTLIVPMAHPFARLPPGESYRQIHDCVAKALQALGLAARLAAHASARVSNGCFENAAEADVLADGRKIAGAAQRRTRAGLLHQGSIQGLPAHEGLAERLAGAFGDTADRSVLEEDTLSVAAQLAREKYATEAWLRRF
jgi:lipoate-protein ligase A